MASTIYKDIVRAFTGNEDKLFSRGEIVNSIHHQYGHKKDSIIPSDLCYNRSNKGSSDKNLFEYIDRNQYKYLGPNYPYSGYILARRKGTRQDVIIGEWKGGKPVFFDEDPEYSESDTVQETAQIAEHEPQDLSQKTIQILYEKYCSILHLEVSILGVAPTETRHLIGRIGEFKCALHKKGYLARRPNQHGFDVVGSDKRKISVKTTAQLTGFISFNKNTIDMVDDVMVIQYRNESFHVIFDGPVERIIHDARIYNNRYEVDLTSSVFTEQKGNDS